MSQVKSHFQLAEHKPKESGSSPLIKYLPVQLNHRHAFILNILTHSMNVCFVLSKTIYSSVRRPRLYDAGKINVGMKLTHWICMCATDLSVGVICNNVHLVAIKTGHVALIRGCVKLPKI